MVAQLSDDNANPGSLQNSYGYSPYGQSTTVGPDNTNNPIQYTSRENEPTGLMFYRARYYDPVLKRFISEDPAGLKAGLNGYRYVDNAPTEFSDPDGQVPVAPIAYAYLRCVASCMAQAAAGAALFDELECFDVGDNAKDCALDCLNPFNWGGKAGAKNAVKKPITKPYKRPSGATTKAQRESVQGQPCVDCNITAPKQVADHKKELVKEYYETGGIDKEKMRSLDAVQSQCPTCSAKQGAAASQYSKQQKKLFGF